MASASLDAELHKTDLATLRATPDLNKINDPRKRGFKLVQDQNDKRLYLGHWFVFARVVGEPRELAGDTKEYDLVQDAYYVLKVTVPGKNEPVCKVYASPEVPIFLEGPEKVQIYDTAEFKIRLSDKFFHYWTMIIKGNEERNDVTGKGGRNIDDLHDAYDADADSNRIVVDLQFQRQGEAAWHKVPAFAMKETFDGNWEFRARPAFNKAGNYDVRVLVEVQHTGVCGEYCPLRAPQDNEAKWPGVATLQLPNNTWLHKFTDADYAATDKDKKLWAIAASGKVEVRSDQNARGRLFRPDGEKFFFVEKPDAPGRDVFFGIGLSRPWIVDQTRTVGQKPRLDPYYFGNEHVDYTAAYLDPARVHGANMTALWMCNWSTLPVHRKAGEYWPTKPWACPDAPRMFSAVPSMWLEAAHHYAPASYDQGRCAVMDAYVGQAESRGIRYLLTLFSHDALRLKAGGYWPGGFYDAIDPDRSLEFGTAATGFSALGEGKPENFFKCATQAPESKFWLYEKNYYRYLFARWGSSRSVGVIEPLAEWEGAYWLRDDPANFRPIVLAWGAAVRTHWRHLETEAGYSHTPFTISTFQVTDACLNRMIDNLDCLNAHGYYQGEVLGSPDETRDRKVNCWSVESKRTDWEMANWHWRFLAQRYRAFARKAAEKGQPCVLGETAMSERPNYGQPWYHTGWDGLAADKKYLGKWYPTYYHRVMWIGLATGQAILPLKWCDGKVQGEARAVARVGFTGNAPPDEEEYPFDLFACLGPIRRFVDSAEETRPKGKVRDSILARLCVLGGPELAGQVEPAADPWVRIKSRASGNDIVIDDPGDNAQNMKAIVVGSGARTGQGKFDAFIGYVIRLDRDNPSIGLDTWVEFSNAEPGGKWVGRWYDPGTGGPVGDELELSDASGKVRVPLPVDVNKKVITWGGPKQPLNPKVGWHAEGDSDLIVKVFKVK
ncbi:MAG: hypothetical protein JW741_11650 [Sedimentisphaerales bacterium]|nr:hypothetical protein [Sedimentisphaerales bacterium]